MNIFLFIYGTNRLKWRKLTLWRPPTKHARYMMIKHKDAEVNADIKRYSDTKSDIFFIMLKY